jgi:hypothetical protein
MLSKLLSSALDVIYHINGDSLVINLPQSNDLPNQMRKHPTYLHIPFQILMFGAEDET